MKKAKKDWIDENHLQPTSCNICDSCFLYHNGRCMFGGPFDGYGQTESQTGTGRTVSESKGDS